MTAEEALQPPAKKELDDEDRARIAEIFDEDIAPRLRIMDARTGNINCEFAGEEYRHWVVQFRSTRFGFEIVDFEYDEDSRSFQLAPKRLITDLT